MITLNQCLWGCDWCEYRVFALSAKQTKAESRANFLVLKPTNCYHCQTIAERRWRRARKARHFFRVSRRYSRRFSRGTKIWLWNNPIPRLLSRVETVRRISRLTTRHTSRAYSRSRWCVSVLTVRAPCPPPATALIQGLLIFHHKAQLLPKSQEKPGLAVGRWSYSTIMYSHIVSGILSSSEYSTSLLSCQFCGVRPL